MRQFYIFGLALFATAVARGAATAPVTPLADAKMDIVGIDITDNRLDPDLDDGASAGISLLLHATVNDGLIVGVDPTSTITSFTDDKGTNLLVPIKPGDPDAPLSMHVVQLDSFPKFSKDRKACVVRFYAPGIPRKGAVSISIKGVLILSIAQGNEEVTLDNIRTTDNTAQMIGDIPFNITSHPPRRGSGTVLALHSDRELTALDDINFFGPDGVKLKTNGWSETSTEPDAPKFSVTREYTMSNLPPTIKIVAKVWKDLKKVKVPFDLKAGLGF